MMEFRNFTDEKRPSITLVLIAVMVVIFFLEPKDFGFGIDTSDPLSKSLALTPSLVNSQPWTLVTSIFLHADLTHLFFNMFALFIFGSFLESRIKRWMFILIFFLAGIFGNIGYMITASNPNIPGLGASGAIYGIMGTLAVLTPSAIVYVGYVPMPMIIAAFFWSSTEFLGLFVPSSIARGAHLGGLFFGLFFGYYLRMQLKKRFTPRP